MSPLFTNSALVKASVVALRDGLRNWSPAVKFRADYDAYVAPFECNLLNPELFDRFEKSFEDGAGGELHDRPRRGRICPAKMGAVRSSSALAVNAFGRWSSDPGQLVIGSHTGLRLVEFEHKLPAVSGRRPPHLDVLLQNASGTVGLEVKCLEYLSSPKNVFADAYSMIPESDVRRRSPWFSHMDAIVQVPYKRLHAAQLIKHWFGLAAPRAGENARRPITLVYLYWEPSDWSRITVHRPGGAPVNPFVEHREDVERFSAAVKDDEVTGVRFEAISTLGLFRQWGTLKLPRWAGDHTAALRSRYEVAIGGAAAH